LYARLEGKLDTKIQVEVSRAKLEAKLEEALKTYAAVVSTGPDVPRGTLELTEGAPGLTQSDPE
jgi:hypothetical protein